MKIAMLGSRGIPAHYSGVETCVENLAVRLAEKGHDVVVYCRPHAVEGRPASFRGVRLVYLPTIQTKSLDTLVHTFLATLHSMIRERPSVSLYFIAGNSPCLLLPRLFGRPTVFNVDGLDSQRTKWGRWARRYLRAAEWLSARVATQTVTDSRVVQLLYKRRFGRSTAYIPYGADIVPTSGVDALERFGVSDRGYILVVKRLVPENGVHTLLEAYALLDTSMPLLIVGDASYEGAYMARLRTLARRGVIFTGYQFGEAYRQLLHHAYVVVEPSEVGGTHPALIEAMAAGNAVIVNNHEPHLEAIGETGVIYDGAAGPESLAATLRELLDQPARVANLRIHAQQRATSLYSWENVTVRYEQLLVGVARRGRAERQQRDDAIADALGGDGRLGQGVRLD